MEIAPKLLRHFKKKLYQRYKIRYSLEVVEELEIEIKKNGILLEESRVSTNKYARERKKFLINFRNIPSIVIWDVELKCIVTIYVAPMKFLIYKKVGSKTLFFGIHE